VTPAVALAPDRPATVIRAGPPVHPAVAHRETAERLLAALRNDEFVLYAQPIVPASTAAQAEAKDFQQEILVRFLEEEQKLLPPGSFLPILDEFGLTIYLDRWVVNRTIRWMRRQPLGAPFMRNAINLSLEALMDRSFAAFVAKQVETGQVPGNSLSFEILLDEASECQEGTDWLIRQLRPIGCTFSLCCYAGEPRQALLLEALRPDFAKLDVDLVGRMDRDPLEAATVEDIASRCDALGIRTIAEHVERAETRERLVEAGVDFVQGFLVGVPGPLK